MRQWTIDAFASGPFKGNPACVVEPFDTWPDAAWMQAAPRYCGYDGTRDRGYESIHGETPCLVIAVVANGRPSRGSPSRCLEAGHHLNQLRDRRHVRKGAFHRVRVRA